MSKIGFDIKNEFIPSFDKFQSDINKRLMFLKFFNQEVPCNMKFSKEELKACLKDSLFTIFAKKIMKNLQVDSYINSFGFKVDIDKTKKANSFFKRINSIENLSFNKINLKKLFGRIRFRFSF